MIKPQEIFLSDNQGYFGPPENPLTEAHCNVWDWDQLRMIKVKGSAKVLPPEEDKECLILAQFADHLSPQVRSITVDDDGLLTGVSTDPMEDDTPFIAYLSFSLIKLIHGCSLADCRTIYYSKLEEIDRLGPGVDLVSYEDESGTPQRVAFKSMLYKGLQAFKWPGMKSIFLSLCHHILI